LKISDFFHNVQVLISTPIQLC